MHTAAHSRSSGEQNIPGRVALTVLAATTLLSSVAPAPVRGQLVAAAPPAGFPANVNAACEYNQWFNWGPAAAGGAAMPAGSWTAGVVAGPVGAAALVVATVSHDPSVPACHPGELANAGVALAALVPLPGGAGADIAQIDHPVGGPHRDVSVMVALAPPGAGPIPSHVWITGDHIIPPPPEVAVASATLFNPLPGSVLTSVTPFFREAGGAIVAGTPMDTGPVAGGENAVLGELPSTSPTGGELSGYSTAVDGLTTTTVGFFGTVDGVPGAVSLASGLRFTDVFALSNPLIDPFDLLFPMFLGSGMPLFAGIDLTVFLSALRAPLAPGDVLTFTNGRSDLAPGIILSTAPVSFGSEEFESPSLYSGPASVGLIADLHPTVVPEPLGVVLLGTGLVGVAVLAGRRRRREHDLAPSVS